MTYSAHKVLEIHHTYLTTLYIKLSHENTKESMKTSWSHNANEGSVIGLLTTEPKRLNFIREISNELVVSAFVIDSCGRNWSVRANASNAGQLLSYKVGQKIKIIGIKGGLCRGAWDHAKRQIVPESILLLENVNGR